MNSEVLQAGLYNFIFASLAVIVYAINSNFAQDLRQSINFWGSVISFHWGAEKSSCKTRLLILLPLAFD
eukprot:3711631-Ditylum_brightwellii.AAC.1